MVSRAAQWAREVKHEAFVRYKSVRWPVSVAVEPARRALYARRPYAYDPADLAQLDLGPRPSADDEQRRPVPRVIYSFWTGDNPLTPNRRRSLERMREVHAATDVEVVLVTPDDLLRYLVPEAPLHPSYHDLHVVHRSDYLRAYFLHFHGGGYADIKAPEASWARAFDDLSASDAWLLSSHKPSRFLTPAFSDARLERLMRRTSPVHAYQCSMIARSRTPLTADWWRLLNSRLDDVADCLAAHPGVGRYGGEGYPLPWTGVLGQILDPVTVKYQDKVTFSADVALNQADYL